MSGSINPLVSLFSAAGGSSDPILDALYGMGGSSSSSNPVQALQTAQQNQTQDQSVIAAQPSTQNAIKAFTKAVNSATSVTQLLSNPAVMSVLLTANGMSDQIGYTALAKQALMSNLSDSTSLANTLSDTRWKTLAETYNFATNGLKAIQNPTAIAAVAQAYVTSLWETQQDSVTPGLSNALQFKAQASTITSVDQILGDPTMRSVVTTALDIPPQIAFQDLGAQENAISSRLDIKQFQDPKFVTSFVQRYLIANAASASTSSTPDITTLAIQGQGILA